MQWRDTVVFVSDDALTWEPIQFNQLNTHPIGPLMAPPSSPSWAVIGSLSCMMHLSWTWSCLACRPLRIRLSCPTWERFLGL